MAAEYWLDSTNTHVRRKGCDDVKPLSLSRYSKALNAIRSAIALVRNEQGARHPTLFAGSAAPMDTNVPPAEWKTRKQKQKGWGTSRPHGWKKDCDEP